MRIHTTFVLLIFTLSFSTIFSQKKDLASSNKKTTTTDTKKVKTISAVKILNTDINKSKLKDTVHYKSKSNTKNLVNKTITPIPRTTLDFF